MKVRILGFHRNDEFARDQYGFLLGREGTISGDQLANCHYMPGYYQGKMHIEQKDPQRVVEYFFYGVRLAKAEDIDAASNEDED